MSDEDLWIRFAQLEDKRSFQILHDRYEAPLLAWVQHCGVRDEARARDLCQDVWVRLVRNRSAFDPTKKWGTWAFHIAKNIARNEGRRLQRQFVSTEADYRETDGETVQFRTAVSANDPEVMMRERQLNEQLTTVVGTLSTEQRAIFRLRFVEGRTNEEVSGLLNIPLSALKAKAKRVRLKVLEGMRDLLDEDA